MSNQPFIQPGSPEHLRRISPSKVAAICGVSRWHSAYTTWLRMKGWIKPEPDSDQFRVGHAYEMALAELWRIEHPGWKLSPGEVQYVHSDLGFDAVCTLDRRACRGKGRRVVELKTARDLYEWGDPHLDGDCPADYALQVQAEQLLSGHTGTADLMVMGPYFQHHTYPISFDEKVAAWMVGECSKFWASLDADTPPDLDDSVSSYAAVRELHPHIDAGAVCEIPESLAIDYCAANNDAKAADRVLRGLKSKMLAEAGSAQYVVCNGERVAARQPHPRGGISLVPKAEAILLAAG